MRRVGVVVAVSVLGSSSVAMAAPRFPTGWWESSQVDGHASFELNRTDSGRYEVLRLETWRDHCGAGYFEGRDPRILVDRRGQFRFRGRRKSSAVAAFEIAAVRGRLTGWRGEGAPLRLYWNRLSAFPRLELEALPVACWLAHTFTMRPVERVPVRDGLWRGSDASGRPVSFYVGSRGRMLWGLNAQGLYPIRCTDGSVSTATPGFYSGWIRANGTVKAPAFAGLRWRDALQARLTGTTATGAFRMLGLYARRPFPHGPSCDSEPIPFQATWVAPPE